MYIKNHIYRNYVYHIYTYILNDLNHISEHIHKMEEQYTFQIYLEMNTNYILREKS